MLLIVFGISDETWLGKAFETTNKHWVVLDTLECMI